MLVTEAANATNGLTVPHGEKVSILGRRKMIKKNKTRPFLTSFSAL